MRRIVLTVRTRRHGRGLGASRNSAIAALQLPLPPASQAALLVALAMTGVTARPTAAQTISSSPNGGGASAGVPNAVQNIKTNQAAKGDAKFVTDAAMAQQTGGTTTNFNNNGTSLVLTVPPAVANNDLMVACYASPQNITITRPVGWTAIPSCQAGNANQVQVSCDQRTASSEPANYTWTFSGTAFPAGLIRTFRQVAASPIDVCGTATGNSTSPQAPSITTAGANELMLTVLAAANVFNTGPINATTASGAPTTQTEQAFVQYNGAGAHYGIYEGELAVPTAGATTAQTGAITSANWAAASIAIKPAASQTILPLGNVITCPDCNFTSADAGKAACMDGIELDTDVYGANLDNCGPKGLGGIAVVQSSTTAIATFGNTGGTGAAVTLTAASESGVTATFTTAARSPEVFVAGYTVVVVGVTPSGYNGTWQISTVPNNTTFTAVLTTSGLGAGSAFGTATPKYYLAYATDDCAEPRAPTNFRPV